MKNYWMDEKQKKALLEQRARDKKRKEQQETFDAVKCTSKTCPKHSFNVKYLQEAKDCAVRWEKTGLLDGIKNKWDRQVTAVLLEGQRLLNEVKYNLKVRTKKTERKHGFNTLEELYRYIDMLANDMKFSLTGDCQPADDQEMVLTIYENTTCYSKDSKILCPKSAGGAWDGYDEHRQAAKK